MFNRKKIKQLEKRIIELEKYFLGKEITKMVEIKKFSDLSKTVEDTCKQIRDVKKIVLSQDMQTALLKDTANEHQKMIGLIMKHFNLEVENIPSQTKLKEKE